MCVLTDYDFVVLFEMFVPSCWNKVGARGGGGACGFQRASLYKEKKTQTKML